jgi:anti-sigma regulatory factor (Ser/Thr protein kinase)
VENLNGVATRVSVSDSSQTAEARRIAQGLARRLDFNEVKTGQVAIVATEAATNLLKHAGKGEILLQIFDHGGQPGGLRLLALDRGPGIANLGESLRDGYSTAGSAGTGLGAISRMADFFDIYTQPRLGTAIVAEFWTKAHALRPEFEIGGMSIALEGEPLSGDAWSFAIAPEGISIFVADGLGHGHLAELAAREAVKAYQENNALPPVDLLDTVHRATRSTRGAAVAVAKAEWRGATVRFAGVGNISGALVGAGGIRHMVSMSGIIGHEVRTFREFTYPWETGSLLVLYSDGLGTRWDLNAYPGLKLKPCSLIAGVLWRDHVRGRDDSTVVVAREVRVN